MIHTYPFSFLGSKRAVGYLDEGDTPLAQNQDTTEPYSCIKYVLSEL